MIHLSSDLDVASINLFNILGEKTPVEVNTENSINTETLKKGIYLLSAQNSAGEKLTFKFIQ
jgi:hypothetical protein